MKRRLGAPILAVGLAALILVPTTFAIGEPGTTLYAQLGTNRFPGATIAARGELHFISENNIRFDVQINTSGPPSSWGVRVYSQGTCNFVQNWVINRTPNAGPSGPFLSVMSNSGLNQFQVNPLDVARVRAALAAGHGLAFMVAGIHPTTGQSYRTCTSFTGTNPGPIQTPTTTTTATQTATTTAQQLTTRTITTTVGTQTFTFTLTEPVTTTTTGLTTRTSTGFSTGTTVQTLTLTGTGTTFTIPPITNTNVLTGTSTGTSTFTSSDATTTVTGTTTFTETFTSTSLETVSTVIAPPPITVTTRTTTFTTPVTTVTITTTL